ncbi:MAG: chemotaxis-specific protein-glutamate methyltransferase CheB [Planctomycetota bacterium]
MSPRSRSASRVLIIDQSAVFRELLGRELDSSPAISVVGTVSNARRALTELEHQDVDLILLDTDLVQSTGRPILPALLAIAPRTPIVILSGLSLLSADHTIRLLEEGASDFASKPPAELSDFERVSQLAEELRPKIRELTRHASIERGTVPATPRQRPETTEAASPSPRADPPRPARTRAAVPTTRFRALGIGSSTGGPKALESIIMDLEPRVSVPIFVTQHMPATFTRVFAERLNALGPRRCVEGEHGMPVERDTIYIAPGDRHLTVVGQRSDATLQLDRRPPVRYCRPAVDYLFASLAEVYGSELLTLVLTGMGDDGCAGAGQVRERGGTVWAQDEESSVVWGMPGAVCQAGLADRILPLWDLGIALSTQLSSGVEA